MDEICRYVLMVTVKIMKWYDELIDCIDADKFSTYDHAGENTC